ncbi:peptide ABC transporter substrate-binding protein [Bariatricus sp. HCP28S3_D3]|uniref:peptide ABC transporter substrate-binding protein n=1 Tax=Bariatricus sp. HCP28S3_D3 TaxID=3438901 RepID=UPI003F894083
MKRRIIALLLTAVMSFSLAACSGSKEKATEGGAEEQYVNTYLAADPTTLDPSLRSDTYSSDILMNSMESLIRVGQRDGEYTFVPGDAETWESDETGTVWTFHLGEDRKWSDGEPVTADQYVYSLQRTADPETGSPNSFFVSPIKNYAAISEGEMAPEELGVEAPDEHTLVITLENPMPSFLESTDASVFYPQRQEIVEQYGEQYGADFDKFVYNGPFKVTEWTHNSSIKIEKNENYWDAENVDLDYVTYQIMSDTAAIMNAYESGQIDVITVSSQEELQKYQADDSNVHTKISGGTISFAFYNTEDELFSNANIRKAFTMAVDQEKVNDIAFSGLREPLYGWIAPAISVGDKTMRSVAGDTLKEMRKETLAKTTAKDILLEGMKELGLGDDPSTLDVTFSLAGTSDWFRTFGEYLQQMYKEALGVDVKIDFSEWGIFSDNVYSGNFQLGFMAWGAYYNDPYDMLSVHLTDFNQIATGWSDPEYDKLVLGASQEMDEDARMQMYIDAENILLEANVMCPFATSVSHQFTKSYLHDKYAEYGQDNLYFTHEGWKNVYVEGR